MYACEIMEINAYKMLVGKQPGDILKKCIVGMKLDQNSAQWWASLLAVIFIFVVLQPDRFQIDFIF
jgi:hypothetical protein